MIRWLIVLTLVIAPVCVAQDRPVWVARGMPPSTYALWYKDAELCIGLPGSFQDVQWLFTPSPWYDGRHDGLPTYALWRPPHRIVINVEEYLDSNLVIHESIHDILSYYPSLSTDYHPPDFFGEGKCAK